MLGWAVKDKHGIRVDTVSGHARGAKVNYLCTARGVMIYATMSDLMIETLWLRHKGDDVFAIQVKITEIDE